LPIFRYSQGTETFNGDDFRTIRAWRRHETRHDRLAVQEDGAGSALTLGAAFFCAGQPAFFAQQPQQGFFMTAFECIFFPVDAGTNGSWICP